MTRVLYKYFLYPLAYLLLNLLKPVLNRKTQVMVQDKKNQHFEINAGFSEPEIAHTRPFWIHAASGELEYARPLIRQLRQRFPQIPILVTHSSPSAKKMLQGLDGIAAWGPLPWDFSKDCQIFLRRWQPRCLLVARTDVWPVMAEECHHNKIPALLFSATFAKNSSRLSGLSAHITTWALNNLSLVQCVSEDDARELLRLSLTVQVSVAGDTRFDQVFHRLQNPKPLNSEARPPTQNPILVAGSTWPEDEAVVLTAYLKMKEKISLILVPHEVDEKHLSGIESVLEKAGVSSIRYSKVARPNSVTAETVLLVDQVGLLAEIYTWGDIAFVGGSFRKQVHSVMEPLAAGLPVLVGPFHHNNREALEFKNVILSGQPGVNEVKTSEDLVEKICSLLAINREGAAAELRKQVLSRSQSTDRVIQWLHFSKCDV